MLAILVPYRNRAAHLAEFAPAIHAYLARIKHRLVVIEQADDKPFNRGKLLNIGAAYVDGWATCLALHDVDLIPTKADYGVPVVPTHLGAHQEHRRYKLPYKDYFGGVTLFTPDQFKRCNGFGNQYWGWGAEDDELLLRVQLSGQSWHRRPGTFRSLEHPHSIEAETHRLNCQRLEQFRKQKDYMADGLNTLTYNLVSRESTEQVQIWLRVEL